MVLLGALILVVGLGIYRVLFLALPFFQQALAESPLLNIACGVFSDATFGLGLTVLLLGLARSLPERSLRPVGRILLGLCWLLVYSLAVHLRYVEHFGMTARPYHAVAMANGEMWFVGTRMVFESWRAQLVVVVSVLMLVFGRGIGRRLEARWRASSRKRAAAVLGGVALAALICHASVIQLRNRPGMHAELRYNMFSALYYNYEAFKHIKAEPMPAAETLAKLRSLLSGPRQYASGKIGREFPLWQTKVATGPAPSAELESLRLGLRNYIEERRQAEGPWNVVVVISESLRANELAMMGASTPPYDVLTPNLSRMARDGVRFTEVVSSGLRTAFGQTSAQCSIYGSLDFSILQGAPMANARCLGDLFAAHGYDNFFFYGADNHFDNQDVFYQFHRIKHVEDENMMPKGGPKAGWGYSDSALFQYAAGELERAKKPFFATVLTLTNHPPLKVPEDAPAGLVREDLPISGVPLERSKMMQYVDWSTGEFYDQVRAKLPHTLFLFIADHGVFWGDEGYFNQIPDYAQLRRIARIPFLLLVPGVPENLKGREVANLASNNDLPPTLLSLLGWNDEAQQFMGEDAFSRQGPVYIDWFNKFLSVSKQGEAFKVEKVADDVEDLVGIAGRYNLLAPASERRSN